MQNLTSPQFLYHFLHYKSQLSEGLQHQCLGCRRPISLGTVRADLRERAVSHVRIGRRIVFDSDRLGQWVADHSVEPLSDEVNGGSR